MRQTEENCYLLLPFEGLKVDKYNKIKDINEMKPTQTVTQTVTLWQTPNITIKREATTNGGEYSSACPDCGGDDRFRIWPNEGENGRFWCRQCDRHGDLIDFLQWTRGISFKEAAKIAGKDLTRKQQFRVDMSWRKPKPIAPIIIGPPTQQPLAPGMAKTQPPERLPKIPVTEPVTVKPVPEKFESCVSIEDRVLDLLRTKGPHDTKQIQWKTKIPRQDLNRILYNLVDVTLVDFDAPTKRYVAAPPTIL